MYGNLSKAMAILLLAAATMPPAFGIVYTLRPGVEHRGVEAALEPKTVLEERLTVNGARGTLEVGVTELSLPEAVASLRPLLRNGQAALGGSSILLEPTRGQDDGEWRRYLVVSMGGHHKTVVFSLKLPSPPPDEPDWRDWPRGVPRPPAASVEQVMHFGKRGLTYVTFRSNLFPNALRTKLDGVLTGHGWRRLRGEEERGWGAMYVDRRERQSVLYSLQASERGVLGAMFVAPLNRLRESR